LPERLVDAALAPLRVAEVGTAEVRGEGDAVLGLAPEAWAALTASAAPRVPHVPLMTCERVLLVSWGDGVDPALLLRAALAARGVSLPREAVRRSEGLAAMRHLIALAAGLRSTRAGETEILGQLRAAWTRAAEAGTTDPMLDRMLRRVIAGARYVRSGLPVPPVATLGGAALEAAATRLGRPWSEARLLVVGTGEAAASTLAAARNAPPAAITVTGRTAARADALASRFGVAAAAWERLDPLVAAHDVVVLAVRAGQPVLDARRWSLAVGPRVVVDLGVPPLVAAPQWLPAGAYLPLEAVHAMGAVDGTFHLAAQQALALELRRFTDEVARRLGAAARPPAWVA
jgi:glutamyl-tRNA reductase